MRKRWRKKTTTRSWLAKNARFCTYCSRWQTLTHQTHKVADSHLVRRRCVTVVNDKKICIYDLRKDGGELPASRATLVTSWLRPAGRGRWDVCLTSIMVPETKVTSWCVTQPVYVYTHTYSTGGFCVNHSRMFVQVSQNIWLILSFYGISLHTINRKGWVGGLSVCQIELHFVILNLIAGTVLLSQDCTLIQEAIFSQITFRFLSLNILKPVWGGVRGEKIVLLTLEQDGGTNVMFSQTVWHKVYHVPKVWNRLCPRAFASRTALKGKGPSLITSDVIMVGEQ